MFEYLKKQYQQKYAEYESALSKDAITALSNECHNKFGCSIPKDYAIFLSELNGFYCNGYSVFGSYDAEMMQHDKGLSGLDLISFNDRFRDYSEIEDFLILGKSSIDYIAYDIASKQYVLLTNGTLDELYRTSSFESIIKQFLIDL